VVKHRRGNVRRPHPERRGTHQRRECIRRNSCGGLFQDGLSGGLYERGQCPRHLQSADCFHSNGPVILRPGAVNRGPSSANRRFQRRRSAERRSVFLWRPHSAGSPAKREKRGAIRQMTRSLTRCISIG
jgi:hypothetical protein